MAWSDKTRHKMFKTSAVSTGLGFYAMLISVVQTHRHAKRHRTPHKNDVA